MLLSSSEILLITFSFLKDPSDFQSCAKTCSNWKEIIDGKDLWNMVIKRKWPLARISIIKDSKKFYLNCQQQIQSFCNAQKSKIFSHRLLRGEEVLEGTFVKNDPNTSLQIQLLTKTSLHKGTLELIRKGRDSKVLSLKDKEILSLEEGEREHHLLNGTLSKIHLKDSFLFVCDEKITTTMDIRTTIKYILSISKDNLILLGMIDDNCKTFLVQEIRNQMQSFIMRIPEKGTYLSCIEGTIFYLFDSKIHQYNQHTHSSITFHFNIKEIHPLNIDDVLVVTQDSQIFLINFPLTRMRSIPAMLGRFPIKIKRNEKITLVQSSSYFYILDEGNSFNEYFKLEEEEEGEEGEEDNNNNIIDFIIDEFVLIILTTKSLLVKDLLSPQTPILSRLQILHLSKETSSILSYHPNGTILIRIALNHIILLSLKGGSSLLATSSLSSPSQPIPIGMAPHQQNHQMSSPYNNVVSSGGGGGSWKCSSKSFLDDALREWEEEEAEEGNERERDARMLNEYQISNLTEEEMIEYVSMLSLEEFSSSSSSSLNHHHHHP